MKFKKYTKIFLLTAILFLLSGCSFIDSEVSRVEVPEVSKSPIEGKWTVTKCIFPDDTNEDSFNYKDIIGTDFIFTNKGVVVGDLYTEEPNFKAKKVNAQEYLFKKYNIMKKQLSITNDSVYVIDIYDDDEFFYEVIKESEDVAYIYMKGFFAQITKSSSEISDSEFEKLIEKEKIKIDKSESVGQLNKTENGFLLGLKSKDLDSKLPKWNYRTIYIKFLDDEVEDVYETDNIMLPKQNDFVNISVNRIEENGKTKDNISITNTISLKNSLENSDGTYPTEDGIKNILFISPEYINVEKVKTSAEEIDRLYLYFMDSLDNRKKIALSDIVEKGEKVFKESANMTIKTNDRIFYDDFNIGLFRNNGYWKLMGRVKIEGEKLRQEDFELNALLPKGIVKYDKLIIPMSEIKKEIPQARDAFISPNSKFLITLENNKLKVYNIENGKINNKSIYEKELMPYTDPVMSEWAIGRYSQIWQRKISSRK